MSIWSPDTHATTEALAHHTLRAASVHNGTIQRFAFDEGTCYRIGSTTTTVENRRLNARITKVIEHLTSQGLLEETGDTFTLTEDGYRTAGATAVHPQSFAILDVLLRAGLCAPRLWEHAFATLPRLAREESIDALNQGALPLPQVIWEWAGTHGHVTLTQREDADLELNEFYEALEDVARHFGIELSTPTHDDRRDVMPPFLAQRMHLVQRSNWFPLQPADEIDEDLAEEIEELLRDDPPSDLPILTDPAIARGKERAGETWVRIPPTTISALEQDPVALLYFLRNVADTRIEQLRLVTRIGDDLEATNEALGRITSWQRLIHTGIEGLEKLPADRRAQAAPGILTILTTMEAPPRPTPQTQPPTDLRQLALGAIWKLPRPLALAIIALLAFIGVSVWVWDRLPETTKQEVIDALIR